MYKVFLIILIPLSMLALGALGIIALSDINDDSTWVEYVVIAIKILIVATLLYFIFKNFIRKKYEEIKGKKIKVVGTTGLKKIGEAFVDTGKKYDVIFWRVVVLIAVCGIYFAIIQWKWFPDEDKYKTVFVNTRPPDITNFVPGARIPFSISRNDMNVEWCLKDRKEAVITYYRMDVGDPNHVAMRIKLVMADKNTVEATPLYTDGGRWVGEYQFEFDRKVEAVPVISYVPKS